jgi:hypothetical protein
MGDPRGERDVLAEKGKWVERRRGERASKEYMFSL